MTTFAWKGFSSFKVPAEIAAAEIDRVMDEYGVLFRPAHLVDASRSDNAPLHPEFEWNDPIAAELWREGQARYIIRSIVTIEDDNSMDSAKRSYVPVIVHDDNENRTFVTRAVALEDPDLRAQVIASALRELNSFIRKYGDLDELGSVVRSIHKIADYMQKLKIAA